MKCFEILLNGHKISKSLPKIWETADGTAPENEMFVLGLEDDEFNDATERHDYNLLNKHLYRVQKISHREYSFRYHTETKVDDKYDGIENGRSTSMTLGALIPFKSISGLLSHFPHKVEIDIMGRITKA